MTAYKLVRNVQNRKSPASCIYSPLVCFLSSKFPIYSASVLLTMVSIYLGGTRKDLMRLETHLDFWIDWIVSLRIASPSQRRRLLENKTPMRKKKTSTAKRRQRLEGNARNWFISSSFSSTLFPFLFPCNQQKSNRHLCRFFSISISLSFFLTFCSFYFRVASNHRQTIIFFLFSELGQTTKTECFGLFFSLPV